MKSSNQIIGKFLYGLLFLILLPIGLYYWAVHTDDFIRFHIEINEVAGLALAIIGGLLMIWAMLTLMLKGSGLPMNAYPPKNFVQQGPYKIFKHPIYWGFGILLVGAFIVLNSDGGLWLVTPITILGMIALVWGYEALQLKDRFPNERIQTLFYLKNDQEKPSIMKRLALLIQIVIVYFLSNFIILSLFGTTEAKYHEVWYLFPYIESSYLELIAFVFMLLPVVLVRKNRVLRNWRIQFLMAVFLVMFFAFLWPEFGAQYFRHQGFEESYNDFLSRVLLAVPIAFTLISLKFISNEKGWMMYLFFLLGALIIFNQLAVNNSSINHFFSSLIIFGIASLYSKIWNLLRTTSDKVANSWKEWVFGNVRIINHGFYVGAGSFLGIFMAGYLVGPKYAWAILVFAVAVIIFSALWAQVIEGSEKLKRPFGYYGALVGILFGSLLMYFMKVNVWVIIGIISVAMPWVQAIGRLRCLINGCCHGAPTSNEKLGIRYHHHRSRVCGISHLKGELLHPTQLYAIIWLFLVGFVLLELWNNEFSYAFIFGLYLILTGLGRFVEEAYRGEAQTVIWKGLRLYQWTAILSVLIGIGFTIVRVPLIETTSGLTWEVWVAGLLGGLITFFAMGVDFPNSNARFSRLV